MIKKKYYLFISLIILSISLIACNKNNNISDNNINNTENTTINEANTDKKNNKTKEVKLETIQVDKNWDEYFLFNNEKINTKTKATQFLDYEFNIDGYYDNINEIGSFYSFDKTIYLEMDEESKKWLNIGNQLLAGQEEEKFIYDGDKAEFDISIALSHETNEYEDYLEKYIINGLTLKCAYLAEGYKSGNGINTFGIGNTYNEITSIIGKTEEIYYISKSSGHVCYTWRKNNSKMMIMFFERNGEDDKQIEYDKLYAANVSLYYNEENNEYIAPTPTATPTPTPTLTAEEKLVSKMSKQELLAYNFVKSIQEENYEIAYEMINYDNKKFFTLEDFKWTIPRSFIADIVGTTEALTDYTSDKGKTERTITLNFNEMSFDINLILNDNNEWKIEYNESIIKDWTIRTRKDTKLFINNIDASEFKREDLSGKNTDIYVIPCILEKEIEMRMTSSIFGDFIEKTIPSNKKVDKESIENFEFKNEFDPSLHQQYLDEIKILLNNLYTEYEANPTKEILQPFISTKADKDLIDRLSEEMDECYNDFSGSFYNKNDKQYFKNFQFTIIETYQSQKAKETMVLIHDDVLGVNIKVEKVFGEKQEYKTRLKTYIYIQITEDGPKIWDFEENNLFNENNKITSQW